MTENIIREFSDDQKIFSNDLLDFSFKFDTRITCEVALASVCHRSLYIPYHCFPRSGFLYLPTPAVFREADSFQLRTISVWKGGGLRSVKIRRLVVLRCASKTVQKGRALWRTCSTRSTNINPPSVRSLYLYPGRKCGS